MKRLLHVTLATPNKLRRVWLIVLSIMFTSISIAGQTYAVDQQFFAGNDILFYDPTCSYAGSTSLTGNGIEEKIWNFLKGQGLSDQQAAGVMGNMDAESAFIPTRFQGDTSFNPYDSASNKGWGLVQWDSGRRFTAPDKGILGKLKTAHPELVKYVDNQYNWFTNKSIQAKIPAADLDSLTSYELNYVVQESQARPVTATGFGNAGNEWATLKLQKSIDDATVFWHNNFEVSQDSPSKVLNGRGGLAKQVYDLFAGKTTTGGTTAPSPISLNSSNSTAPTVFLDPVNGGAVAQYTDAQSGLADSQAYNAAEAADTLDVANQVNAALTQAGYKVTLSRTTATQSVSSSDRAAAAAKLNASIGVSIGTSTGIDQAWPQRVNTSRQYLGRTDTFTNQATAQKSESYAGTIAKTRTIAEGTTITTDPGNAQQQTIFSQNNIPSKGNIPLISLWSPSVPWVYNEISQNKGASLSDARKQAYAQGIVKGIEEALPISQNDQCGNPTFSGGNLQQTIFAYAWPDYHAASYVNKKSEYAAAVTKAQAQGRYVGGIQYPGIDCGGFVTTLMIDSGYEPKYNSSGKGGNTVPQLAWLQQNWQSLGSATSINVADLKPGDVAISADHTFVYAGIITGFHSPTHVASASLDSRAPMAGTEGPTMSGFSWFRKK